MIALQIRKGLTLSILIVPLLSWSCNKKSNKEPNEKIETKCNISENIKNTSISNSLATSSNPSSTRNVIYTPKDSAEVVSILKANTPPNDVLFLARHFIGRPYIANTLEASDPEKLIVNLRGLDCATLVENVCALAMTKRQGYDNFSDFCHNLTKIRYRNGKIKGYLSRLHYFSWWMQDNIKLGIIREVRVSPQLTKPLTTYINYMSKHANKYKMLTSHPNWVDSISHMERSAKDIEGRYLPKKYTNLSKKHLSEIHDGDIIAIVTSKEGLDYSHLGFAVWGKDHKIHLLNASMIHKKVIEEPLSLYTYLNQHKSFIGIRILRIN